MSDVTRNVALYVDDANWLYLQRGRNEKLRDVFSRIRRELETLRENEVKERFREEVS